MGKIVDLKQDTSEWHAYRKTKIGASDFALFCCHKRYSKSIFNIDFDRHIYEKRNGINKTNKYMQKGKDLEPQLLEKFNEDHDLSCFPLVLQHDKNENLFASLDGYDIFKHVGVEVKTTSKPVSELENIKQYYQWQLYHQMECADLEWIYLVIYFIEADYTYTTIIQKKSMSFGNETHEDICNKYLNILNEKVKQDHLYLLSKYENVLMKINVLELEKKNLFNTITQEVGEGVHGDYIIKKVSRKSAKYAQYIKDNNLSLDDKYYSESDYYKISKKDNNDI